MTRLVLLAVAVAAAACESGAPGPGTIALGRDLCANCRMAIVSQQTAAQIVAAGDDPVFFDEVGCLRDYVRRHPLAPSAVAYVADHQTGQWIDARQATFTQTRAATPMTSGLLAHADAASRDADPAARGGVPVPATAVVGPFEETP
jgi:copper chaperone NosL